MLLLISCLLLHSTVLLEPKKIKSVTASTFSPSICHAVMGPDAMIKEYVINIIIIYETLLIFFYMKSLNSSMCFKPAARLSLAQPQLKGLAASQASGILITALCSRTSLTCPLWLVESTTRVKSCCSFSWRPWESCFASLRTGFLICKNTLTPKHQYTLQLYAVRGPGVPWPSSPRKRRVWAPRARCAGLQGCSNHSCGFESSSSALFLFAHSCSQLTLRESNYRSEITRPFNLTPG